MTPDPQTTEKSIFKNPILYSSVILLVVAIYVVFLLVSRHQSAIDFERQKAEKAAALRREDDRAAVEQLGGSDFAVRALYVSPAAIHRGGSAQLCYDVSNAKTVSLDPPEGQVWPSHSRCLPISPKKTTTYTLTIADANGQTLSQSVELKVQ